MIGLALCLALAAAEPPKATSLELSAQMVTAWLEMAFDPPKKQVVAVALADAQTPELSRAMQTALVEELTRRGAKAVLPLSGPIDGAEAAARAAGADVLVRLTVRIRGAELTVSGDKVPTWVNFWTGQTAVRAAGGQAFGVTLAADAQVLALANLTPPPPKGEVATKFAVRALARLPEKVVAVAVGDLDGDKLAEVAALTATQVVVLSAGGQVIARHDLSGLPRAAKPSREPAGALAIERVGESAQLLAFSSLRAKGEVLRLAGGKLESIPDLALDQPELAVGLAGPLKGQLLPGKNQFATEVRFGNRSALLPLAPVSVAGNARPGNPAFALVGQDGAAALLDADLKPTVLAGQYGAALALGDVDGDGAAELVSTTSSRTEDRVRLARPGAPSLLFESDPIAANLVAAAAGDLDADGRDEAVLAGWTADGGTSLFVLGAQR